MKRIVLAGLILALLLCAIPSQAASRFVFRDHITWGMSSEMVQFYEGYSELKKDGNGAKDSFIRYKDQKVSKYEMDLEYYFMGNKLFAATYSKDFGKNADKAYETLCKAYKSKYGDPAKKYASAVSIFCCFMWYLDGEEIDKSTLKTIEENIDKSKDITNEFLKQLFGTTKIKFWVLDDTLIILCKKEKQVIIMYIDIKTVTAENDTTGI